METYKSLHLVEDWVSVPSSAVFNEIVLIDVRNALADFYMHRNCIETISPPKYNNYRTSRWLVIDSYYHFDQMFKGVSWLLLFFSSNVFQFELSFKSIGVHVIVGSSTIFTVIWVTIVINLTHPIHCSWLIIRLNWQILIKINDEWFVTLISLASFMM